MVTRRDAKTTMIFRGLQVAGCLATVVAVVEAGKKW